MGDLEATATQFLLEMAHRPYLLSAGIILILFASSFGLPLPEEVVLVTSGIIAHLAIKESLATGQPATVNAWWLAGICFAAVLLSDLLVFALGRRYGRSLLLRRPINRLISEDSLLKVEAWTQKHGALACVAFRFTPGIRFPGHFMCGALKISYQKFLATDGVAALLTVPTQVLLLAFYGDEILATLKQFKFILLVCLAVFAIIWIFHKIKTRKSPQQSA
jgi:membrane protein DedA with SNARE-associated domain